MNQDYEAKFKVGDKIRLYGKETTIRGFYISYNDALNKYETIMLTDGRGDPFERSLDVIECLNESIDQEVHENLSKIHADWKEKFDIWDNEYYKKHLNRPPFHEICDWIEENVIAPLRRGGESIDEATLIEDLVDKRIEGIMKHAMPSYVFDNQATEGKNAYYLSRKEIAQDLLDKYHIIKK